MHWLAPNFQHYSSTFWGFASILRGLKNCAIQSKHFPITPANRVHFSTLINECFFFPVQCSSWPSVPIDSTCPAMQCLLVYLISQFKGKYCATSLKQLRCFKAIVGTAVTFHSRHSSHWFLWSIQWPHWAWFVYFKIKFHRVRDS